MDANVVGVTTKRRLTHVGPSSNVDFSSASIVPPSRNLQPDELANNQLFEENKPSVVFINDRFPQGLGSGFIWNTEGHIVTNYHVICGACNLSVTLADEMEYKAKVVGYNLNTDVAVLHIDAPKEKLRPIKVGISSNLLIGQRVYAIGHPFGWRYVFTPGVISELGVYFRSPANERPILDGILTNALINPGNSGGPLLDSSGRLIGMVTAMYSQVRESCGVAFAVPVDTVKCIVEQIVNVGKVRRSISVTGESESYARRSRRVHCCGARAKP